MPDEGPAQAGADAAALLGARADERLLGAREADLPPGLPARPAPPPASRARRTVVAVGIALTAASLIAGLALIALAIALAVAGSATGAAVAAGVVGAVLVATHWGWVHVAEAGGKALDRRRAEQRGDRERAWLEAVEPYPRLAVVTRALEDGSVRIERTLHRPVLAAPGRFAFTRQDAGAETRAPEEPAAEVAARAEELRHEAAAANERARERWEAAATAFRAAEGERASEAERAAAVRAAAQALADAINARLRDPPLRE